MDKMSAQLQNSRKSISSEWSEWQVKQKQVVSEAKLPVGEDVFDLLRTPPSLMDAPNEDSSDSVPLSYVIYLSNLTKKFVLLNRN